MNEPKDPLEAELAALEPHPVSRGLQRRIAERLANFSAARLRWFWRVTLAGGLAAACLTVAVVLLHGDRHRVDPRREVAEGQPALAPFDALPTLRNYQCALARSPEALDALLDKHAALGAGFGSPPVEIHAFARVDGQLQTWLGER